MAKTKLFGQEIEGFKDKEGEIVYKPSDVQKILEKMKKERIITLPELILALFYAQDKPIQGMILLMKEVFLMQEEFTKEEQIKVQDADFTDYLYGPYSVDVDDVINIMDEHGLIITEGRRSSNKEIFYLTKKGKELADKAFDKLNERQKKKLRDLRKGWDQLGVEGILKLVYTKYPQYTNKSKIKKRVLYDKGIKRKRG